MSVVEPKLDMDEEEVRQHVSGLLKHNSALAFAPENYTPDHLQLLELNDDPNVDSYDFDFDFAAEPSSLEGVAEEGGEEGEDGGVEGEGIDPQSVGEVEGLEGEGEEEYGENVIEIPEEEVRKFMEGGVLELRERASEEKEGEGAVEGGLGEEAPREGQEEEEEEEWPERQPLSEFLGDEVAEFQPRRHPEEVNIRP